MAAPLNTGPLSGFMELLPQEQMVMTHMLRTIAHGYELFGFIPLETPVLERAEVLLAKAGGETEQQVYRFTKGDTDLAMRFDHTVPLARYVAHNAGHLVFPYKRYAIGKVYRGERPQAGRFRELYQCDIDVIGDGDLPLSCDGELPAMMYRIFRELGIGPVLFRISNRKIISGLCTALHIEEHTTSVMQVIDRLEKITGEETRRLLADMALPAPVIEKLLAFTEIRGTSQAVIDQLHALSISDPVFQEGVAELEMVAQDMLRLGIPEESFSLDLSIVRGLDYYTGTVYETILKDYPEVGSICSGGRYDNLAEHYTKKHLPGVGMSIGLTRIFDQLRRRDLLTLGASTPTKVLMIPMVEDRSTALTLATRLREANIPTEVSMLTSKKVEKHLKYADRLGIPYALFLGEEEIATGSYTLKNLGARTQDTYSAEALVAKLRSVSS